MCAATRVHHLLDDFRVLILDGNSKFTTVYEPLLLSSEKLQFNIFETFYYTVQCHSLKCRTSR